MIGWTSLALELYFGTMAAKQLYAPRAETGKGRGEQYSRGRTGGEQGRQVGRGAGIQRGGGRWGGLEKEKWSLSRSWAGLSQPTRCNLERFLPGTPDDRTFGIASLLSYLITLYTVVPCILYYLGTDTINLACQRPLGICVPLYLMYMDRRMLRWITPERDSHHHVGSGEDVMIAEIT